MEKVTSILTYTRPHLDQPDVRYDGNEIHYKYLRDISFYNISGDKAWLLIVKNYADLLINRDLRVRDPGDSIAVKTVLWWILVGVRKVITNNSINCNSLLNSTLESLNENVKHFY